MLDPNVFFDQALWSCGFWLWTILRQRCTEEHRIGETCGLKLIFETDYRHDYCKICELVVRKQSLITKNGGGLAAYLVSLF